MGYADRQLLLAENIYTKINQQTANGPKHLVLCYVFHIFVVQNMLMSIINYLDFIILQIICIKDSIHLCAICQN